MVRSNISYDKTLQTAIEYITDNWNNDFSVGELAKKCCVSESTLYHLFQKELGQTPVGFLNSIKINIAIKYLESSNYSISTISRLVGFNSENHFRKVFRSVTETTPSKFKKKPWWCSASVARYIPQSGCAPRFFKTYILYIIYAYAQKTQMEEAKKSGILVKMSKLKKISKKAKKGVDKEGV